MVVIRKSWPGRFSVNCDPVIDCGLRRLAAAGTAGRTSPGNVLRRDRGHHPHEVVHRHTIARLEITWNTLSPHTCVPNLAFRVFGIHPEDIERHLPVYRDGLDAIDDALTAAFQHRTDLGQSAFAATSRR